MTSRRRSLLLLGLALVLGSLAASDVAGREAALDRRLGPAVPVVVARGALADGAAIPLARLGVRYVPARFAPRGAYAVPAQVAGRRPAGPVAAGADVTSALLADPGREAIGAPVRRGERVADVLATGDPGIVVAGSHVDVLVTRERRTELALEDVEVLEASAAPSADGTAAPRVQAALRVTVRQAVFLAAAQAFARDVRLLARAPGDRGRTGAIADVG